VQLAPAAAAAAGAGTALDDAGTAAAAAAEEGADGDASDDSSCPQSPKGRLEGVVLETKKVKQRDQVRYLEFPNQSAT
jgi:hypothetical protein